MKRGDRVIAIQSGRDEIGNNSFTYDRGDTARVVKFIWNGHFLILNHEKRETKKGLNFNGTGADIRKWRKL